MTTPVSVPPLIQADPWPSLGAANYNDLAYAAGSTQPTAFARQHEIAEAAYANALSAQANVTVAAGYASQAADSASQAASVQDTVLAAANFKGLWPGLSGPISKPACVKHNSRFWMLLNNLANVATSEPGISADWTSLDSGGVTQTITANTTAVPGVYYVAATAGITLTVPAGFTAGSTLAGRNVSGGDCYINWGTNTVAGQTPEAPMTWPTLGRFETIYNGSTFA